MEIIKKENHVVVKPGKDVVASMANEFRDELESLIQASSSNFILDLIGVETVDSVGVGAIIATHNTLNSKGLLLSVINIKEDIYDIFEAINLHRHLTIKK